MKHFLCRNKFKVKFKKITEKRRIKFNNFANQVLWSVWDCKRSAHLNAIVLFFFNKF